jgi:sigma-B regulation protein RsbU (phosphoserine phosphatase)
MAKGRRRLLHVKTNGVKKAPTTATFPGGRGASLVTTSISGMYSIYDFSKGVTGFISSLNDYIASSFDSQKFVTGIFVEFDENTAELNFYDMGHSYIYIYRHSRLFRLKTNSSNLPLGVGPELDPACDTMTLEQGDLLILITDGIAEQVNPAGEEYGKTDRDETLQKPPARYEGYNRFHL